MDDAARREAAAALADARQRRVPIPPLTDAHPHMTIDDAYAIQLANVGDRLSAGAVVRGHKVGLTAKAMQEMLGVDEPDYGHLLDDMFAFEESTLAMADYVAPRVEPEVAFVLDRPLHGPGLTITDVLSATAYVLPALEIVDSRIADWKIKLPDTVADNASSAAVVLGGNPTRLTDIDVRMLGVELSRNGEVLETGRSSAVLGNPAVAVAWLANRLSDFGVGLEAGHVVMPGACTRMIPVTAGDVVRAEFDGLGHVAVAFG
jgi:2-keto-4-pentenoate hydratase